MELTEEGMSQREVGEVLGVDPMTVNHDLKSVENSAKKTDLNGESVENSTPPESERDEEKEREQALKQERKVRALNLFTVRGA
jgi:predicted transcriptional regulator